MNRKPQTLYRMYNADDQLLYVGITQQQVVRFHQHAREKLWWPEVTQIWVEHYPDRPSVIEAERLAIQTERPRYNIVGNRGGHSMKSGRPVSRDGYGFGAQTGDRWRTESLDCTVVTKRGNVSQTELVLWWELDYEMITDDYLPGEADCFELFEEWDSILRRKKLPDERPIWWFVVGPGVCEFAQGDPSAPNTGHFNEHYYLGDAAGNYRMDIDVLPVASKNWRSGNADKGGFIQQATGWQPTPLLPTVSLSMLRRRMWARRA